MIAPENEAGLPPERKPPIAPQYTRRFSACRAETMRRPLSAGIASVALLLRNGNVFLLHGQIYSERPARRRRAPFRYIPKTPRSLMRRSIRRHCRRHVFFCSLPRRATPHDRRGDAPKRKTGGDTQGAPLLTLLHGGATRRNGA